MNKIKKIISGVFDYKTINGDSICSFVEVEVSNAPFRRILQIKEDSTFRIMGGKNPNLKVNSLYGQISKHWKQIGKCVDYDKRRLLNNLIGVEFEELESWSDSFKFKDGRIEYVPAVGLGATCCYGSDCYPYTIHKVSDDKKTLWASEDQYKAIGGPYNYGDDIEYVYSNPNENSPEAWSKYTLRKDGKWHKGNSLQGKVLYIGGRRYYQDPSF